MTLATLLLALLFPPPPGPVMPMARGPMPADGITVRGSANVPVAATSATLTIYVVSRDNKAPLTQSDLQPLIDAIAQSGVDRNKITVPTFISSTRSNAATIQASVDHPTTDMIVHGYALMVQAFSKSPNVLLQNARVQASSADCTSAARKAEDAAIKDARTQAEHVAQELGVHLGSVLAVDFSSAAQNGAPCGQSFEIGPYNPMQTPQDYLTIHVYSSILMRFAIR